MKNRHLHGKGRKLANVSSPSKPTSNEGGGRGGEKKEKSRAGIVGLAM